MNEVDTKLLLKIHDSVNEFDYKWVHLCYVDTSIYEKYTESKGYEESLNKALSRWCKEDFQVDLVSIDTPEDLTVLKGLIKEYCKKEYPDLFRDSKTDRQGWIRVWVSKKMREEIGEYESSK